MVIPNGSLRDDDEVNAERAQRGKGRRPARPAAREIRRCCPARSSAPRGQTFEEEGPPRGRAVPARGETPLEVRDVQRLSARAGARGSASIAAAPPSASIAALSTPAWTAEARPCASTAGSATRAWSAAARRYASTRGSARSASSAGASASASTARCATGARWASARPASTGWRGESATHAARLGSACGHESNGTFASTAGQGCAEHGLERRRCETCERAGGAKCEHGRKRYSARVRRGGDIKTPVDGVPVQAVRRHRHLRAREAPAPLQRVRRVGHLRAREAPAPLQGVRKAPRRCSSS